MIHNSLFNKLHGYFFYSLLLLLPTQLGYHWWPSWALVLGRRIDYLSPTLYATDILIFFIIFFWIIDWISRSMNHELGIMNHGKNKSTQLFIIPLSLFAGINILFAFNYMVALFAWIKILELFGLGVYIVKTKPKFSSMIIPLSIGVLYSSIIAIIQFFLQHSIGGIFWFLGERTFTAATPGIARVDANFSIFNFQFSIFKLRSYATFPHPNVLGGYLAITLLGILQYANTPINKLSNAKKIFFITTIILGISALVLTFSRSAWVVFVLGILYLVFRKRKRVFFPVICFAIFLILFIGRTFGLQDESVVVREQLNTAAISMFVSSPLIGNGMGNFLVRLPQYLVSRTIYFLQPAHNIYLLLLSEVGLVGACFIFYFGYIYAKHELRIMNHGKRNFASSFIIRNSLFMILLLGFVDHYFLTLQQGQLLFTIFLSLSLSSLPSSIF